MIQFINSSYLGKISSWYRNMDSKECNFEKAQKKKKSFKVITVEVNCKLMNECLTSKSLH